MDICERLQQLRKLANYSQEQLADMLGVSRQAVSKWESGQSNPDINNIIKLSDIYNVTTDYILMGKEPSSVLIENKCEVEKNVDNSPTLKKTLSTISVIGATAIIAILFIAALTAMAFFIKGMQK